MSESVDDYYREVSEKISQLRKILTHQRQLIRQLEEALDRSRKKQQRCEKQYEALQQKYDRLTAKLVFLQTKSSLPRAHQQLLKKKLQAYIATIDQCLELIKARRG